MENIVKHYQTLLECEQFVVTGSLALKYMGMTDKVGDIDIICVNPTEATVELLKRLQNDNPARTKAPEYKAEQLYIFQHEGTKIDVFIEKNRIDTKLKVENFFISPIDRIVVAKKLYNRAKDWIQLLNMSKKIFNQKEFDIFVSNQ